MNISLAKQSNRLILHAAYLLSGGKKRLQFRLSIAACSGLYAPAEYRTKAIKSYHFNNFGVIYITSTVQSIFCKYINGRNLARTSNVLEKISFIKAFPSDFSSACEKCKNHLSTVVKYHLGNQLIKRQRALG